MDKSRPVNYMENDTMKQGYCLLITGGMMSEPVVIVERNDGTIAQIPINKVQFTDRNIKG